jgi:hypothetical protein
MKKLALLIAVMLIAAVGAGSTVGSLAPAKQASASLTPITISIQKMHRQLDTSSLATAEIVGP